MDDVTLHAADSELCFDSFPRAQVLRRLGSGGEIGLIRIDKPGIPARLLVDLLYGCGLRVSEPLELRVKDILWQERQLVVRAAKGAKDRRVPIPNSLIDPIRAQMETARKTWEEDRQFAPKVGVPLPHQLAKKYPTAPFSWAWFWIFPAKGHCIHPRTGQTVRYHLLHDRLQQAVREAARRVGLDGFITPHVLRHGYATHSRESIEALREIMGHNSIETTAGYRHPVVEKATNPLDDLLSNATHQFLPNFALVPAQGYQPASQLRSKTIVSSSTTIT